MDKIEVQNAATETKAHDANDISNPDIPFVDYQRIRRGEVLESSEKTAPDAKATEQKESLESVTEEKEESEESKNELDSENESDELNDSEKDKPRKKGGFQRRIDKLNSRISEKDKEVEYWKAQALKDANAEKKNEVESNVVSFEGKPIADNFDTHAEYVEALTDWKTEQKFKEREQNAEKVNLQNERQKIVAAYNERAKSFAEKNDDYFEVIESVDDIPLSVAVQEILLTSENSAELTYELAKNREELARIAKLPPIAAAREIGRIETRMLKSSDSKPIEAKKITNAPKPIETIGRGSSGAIRKSINDPEIPFKEYERIRREQMKRRA
jgi:hypothetical protein